MFLIGGFRYEDFYLLYVLVLRYFGPCLLKTLSNMLYMQLDIIVLMYDLGFIFSFG